MMAFTLDKFLGLAALVEADEDEVKPVRYPSAYRNHNPRPFKIRNKKAFAKQTARRIRQAWA
jgi:hypothetical protein